MEGADGWLQVRVVERQDVFNAKLSTQLIGPFNGDLCFSARIRWLERSGILDRHRFYRRSLEADEPFAARPSRILKIEYRNNGTGGTTAIDSQPVDQCSLLRPTLSRETEPHRLLRQKP